MTSLVEENRRTRRIVVRAGRGDSLRDVLESAARDRAVTTAWVSAHGVVARATLEHRSPMREAAVHTVEGPFELVSLTGDLASHEGVLHLEATVVLSRYADHGMVVVAGRLVDADVEGVTAMLDCLDDLGLRRDIERPSGLLGFRTGAAQQTASPHAPARPVEPRRDEPAVRRPVVPIAAPAPAPEKPKAPEVPSAWAAVAAVSSGGIANAPAADVVDPIADRGRAESSEEFVPAVGDWVDHRQFGLCRVDRSTPDGELLIKLETGRRKEIRLDFLEVLAPRVDGARKIFPLRPRKR